MLFQDELLRDERIVWSGQPNPKVVFSKADIFLVPFSLMWGGFAIFWETTVIGFGKHGGAPLFFILWGIPFVLIGLYMMFGRFIYKVWKKRRTYYAVTNKRVLVLTATRGKHVDAAYINAIPTVNKSVRCNGVGTVTFGNAEGLAGSYGNTGMSFGSYYGQAPPTFYDIRGADEVYQLVQRLRNEPS